MSNKSLPQKLLPVLLTDNFFLFPSCSENLKLNDNYRKIIINSLKKYNGEFLIISSKKKLENHFFNDYDPDVFFAYGSLVKIKFDLLDNNEEKINFINEIKLVGLERIEILKVLKNEDENILLGNYKILIENSEGLNSEKIRSLTNDFLRYFGLSYSLEFGSGKLSDFADFVVQKNINLTRAFKQKILAEYRLEKRLNLLIKFGKNNEKKKNTGKKYSNNNQRFNINSLKDLNFIILDQINSKIASSGGDEKNSYRKRLNEGKFPKHVIDYLEKQIKNLEKLPPYSSEWNLHSLYLDFAINFPWSKTVEENSDIDYAKEQLDKNHYGLEKIKEKILLHLVANEWSVNKKGRIICIVGPYGTGKTSLAISIAAALKRPFCAISMAGISDEAEIRGHRRTYVGSMPGKIIKAINDVGVSNPVILLDEVDKINNIGSFHGNPASALLEVLDYSTNNKFLDNWLDIPFNISKAFFILTANSISRIPPALLDRIDIIELKPYSEFRKLEIAKRHLIPDLKKEYSSGPKYEINFYDDSISNIIKYYTREAGVRELKRKLEEIILIFLKRKFSKDDKTEKEINFDTEKIIDYLGKKKYDPNRRFGEEKPGVVNGLAYISGGYGDTLQIEVGYFPGKGRLSKPTGKIGEVMRESTEVAFNYVKCNYKLFGIDEKLFFSSDTHVHFPEGAIPKEGPSAGIAIATSIISAFTGIIISSKIGMTGEITLTGNILGIGGLPEKSIAAYQNGIKTIIIPKDNEKDLDEIPEKIRDKLNINYFKDYYEVWKTLKK